MEGQQNNNHETTTQQSIDARRFRRSRYHRSLIYHSLISYTMKTLIQILVIVAATFLTLNAIGQTGLQHQQYNEDMKFNKQFMTKYERNLVSMYNNAVRYEADRMQRKAIKNGIVGIFFPVFLVPATIQAVRLVKCHEELNNRRRYYSNL